MAAPAYLETGNNADLARLIKDGAIFIRPAGTTDVPTSTAWTPADAETQLGYYDETGFVLTPVPGDETTINAHNGDPIVSESAPGWWTVAFSGLEGNERITSVYFDVTVASDGSVTVTKAAASRRYDIVTVGLDQKDRLIVAHYPNVQLDNSSRTALTFNRTTLLAYGLQFKTFKGGASAPYHFKAWGFVADEGSATWSAQITGTPTGGTYELLVDGTPTSAIAYDALAPAVQTALNAVAGVTGAIVSGTTTKAITFTEKHFLTADSTGLTGGTTPAVVVTATP